MTPTTRTCATCAVPITVTPRNPNRRYCSPRCRVADWHARNNRRPPTNNNVPHGVPNLGPDDVPAAPRPGDATPTSGSLTRYPRCQTPLTVLTWLLPPAAAQVAIPQAPEHG